MVKDNILKLLKSPIEADRKIGLILLDQEYDFSSYRGPKKILTWWDKCTNFEGSYIILPSRRGYALEVWINGLIIHYENSSLVELLKNDPGSKIFKGHLI